MQGFNKVPKEFENLIVLSSPCTDKEVVEMITILSKIKHADDIVMIIRRLAFERDRLRDEVNKLRSP